MHADATTPSIRRSGPKVTNEQRIPVIAETLGCAARTGSSAGSICVLMRQEGA